MAALTNHAATYSETKRGPQHRHSAGHAGRHRCPSRLPRRDRHPPRKPSGGNGVDRVRVFVVRAVRVLPIEIVTAPVVVPIWWALWHVCDLAWSQL